MVRAGHPSVQHAIYVCLSAEISRPSESGICFVLVEDDVQGQVEQSSYIRTQQSISKWSDLDLLARHSKYGRLVRRVIMSKRRVVQCLLSS